MLRRIVECVPNFSEGRDPGVVHAIVSAIRDVPGVLLLGQEQDEDHHRAVITFVGPPDAVVEAAVRAAAVARERIDLRRHQGVHPRIGALDVLPFIPVQNITLAECAQLAQRAARLIWERCGIPSYLYEAAAQREERRNLADVRRGGFEALLREAESNPDRRPDIGGPHLHPSAGAVAVGARKFLIAWNVLLRSEDVSAAREIASLVRQSSGGFPFVKALGLSLPSRGITQVSMNLLDFEETPMQPVFDVICEEAERRRIEVIGSELIGFLPRKALEVNVRNSLRFLNLQPDRVLEHRIETLESARFRGGERVPTGEDPANTLVQALDLVAQAASHSAAAFRLLPVGVPGGGEGAGFLGRAEEEAPMALVREAQETADWLEKASRDGAPVADAEQRILRQVNHCVDLKTRLVTSRQWFLESQAGSAAACRFQAGQALADASLRMFLLYFQQLEEQAGMAEEVPGRHRLVSQKAASQLLHALRGLMG